MKQQKNIEKINLLNILETNPTNELATAKDVKKIAVKTNELIDAVHSIRAYIIDGTEEVHGYKYAGVPKLFPNNGISLTPTTEEEKYDWCEKCLVRPAGEVIYTKDECLEHSRYIVPTKLKVQHVEEREGADIHPPTEEWESEANELYYNLFSAIEKYQKGKFTGNNFRQSLKDFIKSVLQKEKEKWEKRSHGGGGSSVTGVAFKEGGAAGYGVCGHCGKRDTECRYNAYGCKD